MLVNGATGALGSAAVQLLKSLGAVVTAICDTEHVELVRCLGTDRVTDYTTEDFTKDEQMYDVVLDAVGKSSFDCSSCSLEVDCGAITAGQPVSACRALGRSLAA